MLPERHFRKPCASTPHDRDTEIERLEMFATFVKLLKSGGAM